MKQLEFELQKEFKPIQTRFHQFLEHRRNFPTELYPFLLRDIFNFTKEEIKQLNLIEYNIAIMYALEAYTRRDMLFIVQNLFSNGKKKKAPNEVSVIFSHPEIDKFIEESYRPK